MVLVEEKGISLGEPGDTLRDRIRETFYADKVKAQRLQPLSKPYRPIKNTRSV